ncbi:hypothetical protein DAPPUDRAFT_99210 [Daphnia pulex]|uniref:Uncharacterized protein n=1 Tax=Daphnia pulex TaxID=6669 RepID=E9G613_DAPPU|nr:hypothetical protein DAPPUDRAFT_99210 [Daphnia pulex]|eukprot:EFX85076.1 hypothetical protein DAPPUDRAFT_99210 [Daphnia pulex]
MSALCAFPPLIPAGGGVGVYSAGYMSTDVSSSSSSSSSLSHVGRGGVVGSFAAYSNAMATSQQSRVSGSAASIPAYGSTFAAFHPHHPSAVAATTGNGGKSVMKMTQPESAWSSRTSSSATATTTAEPPAAKRRCTDKIRSSSTAWSDQHAPTIWQSAATSSIPASVCPSGCTMCHLQRQQQQQQVQQHPSSQYPGGFHHQAYDSRRPLQEKHQNREESALVASTAANNNPSSNAMATGLSHLKSSMGMKSVDQSSNGGVSVPHRMPNVNRTLSVDPKKDYSAPLHVDCSVEYDLPRIVRPPPGAEPLLVFAPPRSSAVASLATPSGYHPSTWTTTATNSRPLPPQWNQQQQQQGAASRIKSDKPSAASVKSHPAAIQQQQQQQQQQQKLNSTSKSSNQKSSLLFQLEKKGIDSDPIRPVTETRLLPCRICEWVELRRVSGDGLNLISSPPLVVVVVSPRALFFPPSYPSRID